MPTPARRIPLNTYRLQLHAGFTFADAAAQLDYLVDLGITDLYLSPILEAVPGSTHGYDVVDPSRVSDERGGRAGFEALARAAHALGLGVFVDIVPNHMAIPTPLWLNPPLWSVLRDGPDSPCATWFDIEPGARLVLPNVQLDGDDDPVPALIATGRLAFGDLESPHGSAEPVITLDDQPYPLAPGTESYPLAEAVAAQRYSLQRWQGNHTPLTHRRFFDIVTLIGVRQEIPEVFDATHALLLELFHAGHIDGFRVDHPDGLADPQGYFERLHEATGGAWVVAEKILSGNELLPPEWPVAGTTGYEASWRFDAVQLDPAASGPLIDLAQHTDEPAPAAPATQPSADGSAADGPHRPAERQTCPEVVGQAKRFVADGSLAIDVDRLTRLALQLDPSHSAEDVRLCLREFLVALDRYRAYVRPGSPLGDEDAAVLAAAAARAADSLPPQLVPALTWLHTLAAGAPIPPARAGERSALPVSGSGSRQSATPEQVAAEFAIRFQQVSGALVAKGVEDTAFYRWTQLLTLCEVGGEPEAFGLSPDELHAWLGRVNAGWPATMSSGSTHDSKRSEDVRARIAAISEYPDVWTDLVSRLAPLAPGLPAPIRTILWQTLAGTWTDDGPISADRIAGYLVKAGREQKLWTSWVSPDDAAEETLAGAVPRLLADEVVHEAFADWVDLTQESVRTNTLTTKVVQLTALGVADLYQGQETVRLSLTDPDNRRPVDFGALRESLAALRPGDGSRLPSPSGSDRWNGHPEPPGDETRTKAVRSLAADKLLLTHLALELRKRHPEAFVGGAYLPLASSTGFAWGFARGDEPTAVTVATRLPRRRARRGGWQPTDRLDLPHGIWRNLLTGREHHTAFRPGTGLEGWPAALLERIE